MFPDEVLPHTEFIRFGGRVTCSALPIVRYRNPETAQRDHRAARAARGDDRQPARLHARGRQPPQARRRRSGSATRPRSIRTGCSIRARCEATCRCGPEHAGALPLLPSASRELPCRDPRPRARRAGGGAPRGRPARPLCGQIRSGACGRRSGATITTRPRNQARLADYVRAAARRRRADRAIPGLELRHAGHAQGLFRSHA